VTIKPVAVHTAGVEELTEVAPSPVVDTMAVKPRVPPRLAVVGKLEIVGVLGVALESVS
jgi:hypothetical protein